MNCDCAFRIGYTHSVCQDYVRVSQKSKSSYIVLSDGCSSSPDTDYGARLLVGYGLKACEKFQGDSVPSHDLGVISASGAAFTIESLGLDYSSIDATLLACCVNQQEDSNIIRTVMFGDGIFVVVQLDGTILALSVEYPTNFPFYPSYYLDDSRYEGWWYRNTSINKPIRKIFRITKNNNPEIIQTLYSSADIGEEQVLIDKTTWLISYSPDKISLSIIDDHNYKAVALFSDGIYSFYRSIDSDTSKSVQPIPFSYPLKQLLSYKSTKGLFIQRRMNKFLKEIQKQDWRHNDDLSLGVIALG